MQPGQQPNQSGKVGTNYPVSLDPVPPQSAPMAANSAYPDNGHTAAPPMPAQSGGGFTRFTRHPETGNWENAEWSLDQFGPGRMGVTFSDGKAFDVVANKIEHAAANTSNSAPVAQPKGAELHSPDLPAQPAPANQLNPDYEKFKFLLVKLDTQAQALFELPLDVLLTMVHRLATQKGLSGSGKMGVYGGMAQFVPDENTFDTWVTEYLAEVQRREAAKSMPEA